MSTPAAPAGYIESVAELILREPAYASVPTIQIRHRFDIILKWDIPEGSQVLELGCGQGECTATLAHLVGPSGHVTAIDPGPIDTYGSPYTLAQAQQHLSKGPLGSRITWVEADPIEYFKSCPDAKYDFAVLVNCIWYFSSPTTLGDIFRALAPHAARIMVAEWALTASSPTGMPHVVAALAQASLYPHLPSSQSNVRTLVSPSAIKATAAQSELTLLQEELMIPTAGLQDGRWEVGAVKERRFLEQINEHVELEKEKLVLYALRDATLDSAKALEARGEKVECMDVWTGVFTPTK